MANSTAQSIASYGSSALAMIGGIAAQIAPDTTAGQAGVAIGAGGLTMAICFVIRDVAPHAVTFMQIWATNREANIRMQVAMAQLVKEHAASLEEIQALKAMVEATNIKANESENLAIEAKARADELARHSSERFERVEKKGEKNAARITAMEQTPSTSGDDISLPLAPGGDDA